MWPSPQGYQSKGVFQWKPWLMKKVSHGLISYSLNELISQASLHSLSIQGCNHYDKGRMARLDIGLLFTWKSTTFGLANWSCCWLPHSRISLQFWPILTYQNNCENKNKNFKWRMWNVKVIFPTTQNIRYYGFLGKSAVLSLARFGKMKNVVLV